MSTYVSVPGWRMQLLAQNCLDPSRATEIFSVLKRQIFAFPIIVGCPNKSELQQISLLAAVQMLTCASFHSFLVLLPACPEAPDIANGIKTVIGNLEYNVDISLTSRVTYRCNINAGFRLVGERELFCIRRTATGRAEWSSSPPRCVPSKVN